MKKQLTLTSLCVCFLDKSRKKMLAMYFFIAQCHFYMGRKTKIAYTVSVYESTERLYLGQWSGQSNFPFCCAGPPPWPSHAPPLALP